MSDAAEHQPHLPCAFLPRGALLVGIFDCGKSCARGARLDKPFSLSWKLAGLCHYAISQPLREPLVA